MSEPVPTGCPPIDELLGGGFERGAVTQVYGPPAAGKTNLVLSAAVELAASGSSALFVDTEGLSPERLRQLAAGHDAAVETIAGRIIVSEAHSFEEQEQAVRDVEEFVDAVDFVIVDSATGFYRLERTEQEEGEALRAVGRQLAHLLGLARQHDLAVAVTNQVFTDPDSDRPRPLGGHTLDHWSATILRVERFRGGNRRATLEKHRAQPAGESTRFRITADGLASASADRQ